MIERETLAAAARVAEAGAHRALAAAGAADEWPAPAPEDDARDLPAGQAPETPAAATT